MILNKWRKRTDGGAKPGSTSASASTTSTQAWLPIKDVHNDLIHRKDEAFVAGIRVTPVNLQLLSENESLRKIKSLEEVLNGLDYPYQIISIARPVDLDAYMLRLEHMKNEADRLKKTLLNGYLEQAAAMATSGEALERQFYVLIDEPPSQKPHIDQQALYRKAHELAVNLSSSDLTSTVCTEADLRDLLFIFANPNQAAFERAPLTSTILPPLFQKGESS